MRLIRKVFLAMLWLVSLYLAAISLPGCGEILTRADQSTIKSNDKIEIERDDKIEIERDDNNWGKLTQKANEALADEKNMCK